MEYSRIGEVGSGEDGGMEYSRVGEVGASKVGWS